MTRIRFKGFSRHWLSQTDLLARPDTPRTSIKRLLADLSVKPTSNGGEMARFAKAFAVGLADQAGIVVHQGAGHGTDLIMPLVDRTDGHDLGRRAAQEHLACL